MTVRECPAPHRVLKFQVMKYSSEPGAVYCLPVWRSASLPWETLMLGQGKWLWVHPPTQGH